MEVFRKKERENGVSVEVKKSWRKGKRERVKGKVIAGEK